MAPCTNCGAGFTPRNRTQKFCSDRCRYEVRDRGRRFPCASCGSLIPRGSTSLGPGVARCNNCWRGPGHGARRGARVSKTLRLAIYERDGWTCGICDEQIDRAADYQDSWAATLDHITPRALGGTDTPDNLRAAHRWCNTVRGTSEWLTLEEVS